MKKGVTGWKMGVTPMKTERGEAQRRGYLNVREHPLYDRWAKMMHRCYNPNHNRYKYYGAKGIRVITRWHNFWNFVDDMLPSLPQERSRARKDRYTLSRRDHSKNYSPFNVRWQLPAVHYAKKRVLQAAA